MRNLYTLLILLFLSLSIYAQSPEKMSYQAVVRDANNTLLANKTIGMQISIIQSTISGTAVYTESHSVDANSNGLVSLEIGTGSTLGNFSLIDWSAGPYFIKTETDPTGGSSYTIIGTSQLMSVPFALYAKTSRSSQNNANDIATNATDIATNTANIAANDTDIATNANDITNNTNDIATNATDIATNAAEIAANDIDIAANAIGIANNTDDIATNATDIATNAIEIAANDIDIAANASGIANNVTDIADNVTDIATNATDIVANANNINTNASSIADNAANIAANDAAKTYSVNTFYAELGGYVIEVRDGGKHGLVVAMQDQGVSNWYEADNLLSNANNHDAYGARFMDWRLPTKRELNLMYGVFSGGNGASLSNVYYWSSTERRYDDAWRQNFSNGSQVFYTKNGTPTVRAVRAF